MSTIRYLEDVPHIVRYGMQDDKEEKGWIVFWRNGVGFKVEVSHVDVRGTPFSKTWLEYLKEPSSFQPPLEWKEWVHRWDSLCDCILNQCMPLLRELAPSSKGWVALDDYLHTPSYELKMVTDEATQDAVPQITEGPRDTPSYEHWPTAAANIEHLPTHAPRYQAKDLIVLDQAKNWRRPPKKVQAPDGQVYFFKPCEKTSKNFTLDAITNDSIAIINVYSRLFTKTPNAIHIPRIEGIVVTDPSPDIQDSSPSVDWSEDPRSQYHNQQHHAEKLVAGILLTYLDNAPSLAKLLRPESASPTKDQKEKWKKQIVDAVEFLHGQNITIGGRSGINAWYFINQHTVRIAGHASDAEGDAWLTLEAGCTFHERRGRDGANARPKFDEEQAMDLEGVEKTFDF
jgi:hypothetical protein